MRIFAIIFVLFSIALIGVVSRPAPGTAAGQQTGQSLKKEELKAFYENMGYELKDLGDSIYQIEFKRDAGTIYVQVSLSSDLSRMWFVVYLGVLTEGEKSNPKFLLALVEKNGAFQPTHFYVRQDKLRVGCSMDNRAVTAAIVKKELDRFVDDVFGVKDYWDRK